MEHTEPDWWRQYQQTGAPKARQALIALHSDWARAEAAQWARQLAISGTELADFEQLALLGLLEAIEQYNVDMQVPFRLFARFRLKGSILNSIFTYSEKSAQWSASRRLEPATEAQGEDPLSRVMARIELLAMRFLLQDSVRESPKHWLQGEFYSSVELECLKQKLLGELLLLAEPEQSLMLLHYQLDASFTDIADFLKLSKGRISQLHKDVVSRLGDKLAPVTVLTNKQQGYEQDARTKC